MDLFSSIPIDVGLTRKKPAVNPLEHYLDEILKDRNKDRNEPVSERHNLDPHIVLRETDSDIVQFLLGVKKILS